VISESPDSEDPDHGLAAGLPGRIRGCGPYNRHQNGPLWALYQARRGFLRERPAWRRRRAASPRSACPARLQPSPPLEGRRPDEDELVLFHGTSEGCALAIAEHGFDERVASDQGLYGAGSYFADRSCKSHQYAARHAAASGEMVLLVCRVAMGWACPIVDKNVRQRRPPANPDAPERVLDSIFAESGVANGGRQRHHELVAFHGSQAYPEYMVYYVV
jgi:hypothetical protein